MNKREAKRLACWSAAQAIQASLDAGWPFTQVDDDEEQPYYGHVLIGPGGHYTSDGARLDAALREVVEELERRGYE